MRLLLWLLDWARTQVLALSCPSPEPCDGEAGSASRVLRRDEEEHSEGLSMCLLQQQGLWGPLLTEMAGAVAGQRVSEAHVLWSPRGHLGEGSTFPSMSFPSVPQQVAALEEATLARRTPSNACPQPHCLSIPKTDAASSKLCSKFSEGTLIRWLENAKWFNCCRK